MSSLRAIVLALAPLVVAAAPAPDLVLRECATVWIAPDEQAVHRADVVIHAGTIVAVAPHASPVAEAPTLDCTGLTVTAGFQNNHVHLTPSFVGAGERPAAELTRQLEAMFNRYGFTTVVDTGSVIADSTALRARIESGEVAGPRILTAGTPLYPPDGIPIYLRDLPPELLARMPQPASPEEAAAIVKANRAAGADVVKLFAGSVMGRGVIKPMPIDVARAAVAEAHRAGMLVFAHPSDMTGADVAVDAGVDVLAHTNSAGWEPALIERMVAKHVALVPTLKLWLFEAAKEQASAEDAEAFVRGGISQLETFAKARGQVLFGTDAGYMTDYDPTVEYTLMTRAQLSATDILRSLTASPAARFGDVTRGRVAPGFAADLAVLETDPAADVTAFAKVRYTIRAGRVIWAATPQPALR